jgi:hypothetical protein
MKKGGRKTFWVAVSYGENYTFLALLIFSTKMFKAWALLLEHFLFYVMNKFSDVPFLLEIQ